MLNDMEDSDICSQYFLYFARLPNVSPIFCYVPSRFVLCSLYFAESDYSSLSFFMYLPDFAKFRLFIFCSPNVALFPLLTFWNFGQNSSELCFGGFGGVMLAVWGAV